MYSNDPLLFLKALALALIVAGILYFASRPHDKLKMILTIVGYVVLFIVIIIASGIWEIVVSIFLMGIIAKLSG